MTPGENPTGDAGRAETEQTGAIGQPDAGINKPEPVAATAKPAPPTRKSSLSFTDIDAVRQKAAKARASGWNVTLVSGLEKDDEVEVTLGPEANVVGYEVSSRIKKKWELREKDGLRRTLATFKQQNDALILDVNPKADLLRFLTFTVGVNAKNAAKEEHEFAVGVPIGKRLSLTPAETPRDSGDPLIQSCGNAFHLFSDRNTSDCLNRILILNPELRLVLTFDGERLTGGVEGVDSTPSLVVKRLKGKNGTPYSPDKREVCGFVLAMPDAKTGTFRLINYWIQNPSTEIPPSSQHGIRLLIPPVEGQAVADLLREVEKAEKDVARALAATQKPDLTEEEKAAADAAHKNAIDRKDNAGRNLSAGTANYKTSKSFVTTLPLSDFQEVPVRISLCRPGSKGEIVIVDSLQH